MPATERRWAGDAVVVGGGATGLLTARGLAQLGHEVTLVEADGLGAAQSNHSHGYLHRGHTYLSPGDALVATLGRGADAWLAEYERLGLDPLSREGRVGFVNPVSARAATERWRAAGLWFEDAEPPAGFDGGRFASFHATREATIDLTPWLETMRARGLPGVRLLRGTATRVLVRDGAAAGVEVDGRLELLAGHTVLAAGTGNLRLAESATAHRGRAVNRTSYMLVLAARGLLRATAVIPDHEAYGLFLAPRGLPDGRDVWLVSNYVSYAGGPGSPRAALLWARALARTLRRYTHVFDHDELAWGLYAAPKGEVRFDRRSLNQHVVERYGLANLFVASPTKLTLVPLLAGELVEALRLEQPLPRPHGLPRAEASDVLAVRPECWTGVPLRPASELLELSRDGRLAPALAA